MPEHNETPTTIRLPAEVLTRAEALVEVLQADPEAVKWGRISRSTVLRLAVVEGLKVLEQKHG